MTLAPQPEEDARIPQRFDGLSRGRRLACGGLGEVFAGVEERSGRAVAIKLLRRDVLAQPAAVARFRREVDLGRSLRCPGLLRVRGHGVVAGRPYSVTRRLSGPSLRELYAPLSAAAVCRLGVRVARTLACVHDRGVVHRDVSPANVVLDLGAPILIDLGFARRRDSTRQTLPGERLGTPGYLPPAEAGLEGGGDPRDDVFGLGVTLAELLLGRDAAGVDPAVDRRALLCHRYWPGAGRRQHRRLARALAAAIHPDPRRRPAHAEVFATLLASA